MSDHKLAMANLQGAVLFDRRPSSTRYESPSAAGGVSANIGAMHAAADLYYHASHGAWPNDIQQRALSYWTDRAGFEREGLMLNEQFSPIYGAWIVASWAAVWVHEPELVAPLLEAYFLAHAWVAQDGITLPRYADRIRGPALPVCGARGYPERVSNPLTTRLYCIATEADPFWWKDPREAIRLANADWMWPAWILKATGYRLPPTLAATCREVSGGHSPARKLFPLFPNIRTRAPHVFFRGNGVTGSYMDGNPNGNTPPTLAAYCMEGKIGALQPHGRARRVGHRDPANAQITADGRLWTTNLKNGKSKSVQLPNTDLAQLCLGRVPPRMLL